MYLPTPIGPSLQLALIAADVVSELTSAALKEVWERWLGPQRHERKLTRLAQLGLIESSPRTASTDRIIRLTEAGRAMALGGCDPDACWRRPWDGHWRIVLFDVPEIREALRKRLRRKLRALRFGYLQNSAWISPDPTADVQAALAESAVDVETLAFFEGRPCGGERDAQLVAGAWDFARINRAYDLHAEILRSSPSRWRGAADRRRWLEVEWRAWCAAVRYDPFLPEALLPSGYRGRTAWLRRRERLPRILRLR